MNKNNILTKNQKLIQRSTLGFLTLFSFISTSFCPVFASVSNVDIFEKPKKTNEDKHETVLKPKLENLKKIEKLQKEKPSAKSVKPTETASKSAKSIKGGKSAKQTKEEKEREKARQELIEQERIKQEKLKEQERYT